MYELFEIVDERRRKFLLALPAERGAYTAELVSFIRSDNNLHQHPNIAVLIGDILRGRGTLIDVGASLGLVSLPTAVSGSNVVAIEPLPENCVYHQLSILQNRLGNIRLIQAAAGERRAIVGLAGSEAWGHVVPAGTGQPAVMMTLDDIVDLVNTQARRFVRLPVCIKIDTEGHELAVLRGSATTIARYNPTLLVECIAVEGRDAPSDRHTREVKNFLAEQGYHLYVHRGGMLVPRKPADLQEGHVCDFFASRHRYRPGDRIGRFRVGELSFAQSLDWVGEMTAYDSVPHRLHAAGVVTRWIAEGRRDPALFELSRRLCRDRDPRVAQTAGQLLAEPN